MTTQEFVDGVEVAWRPGCPFCMRLRTSLKARGITTSEVDIWSDPSAAARVRAVTGGDEIVPTVFIGNQALVNPSAKKVIATMKTEFPDRGDLHRSGGLLARILGRG